MTDDAFHLTALDARRYDFGNALRGYDRARVDQFRDQVAEELERMSRVNQELEAKARNFHEQLRAFRERDKALNEALISAQQLRSEIRDQAEREAQLIVREARGEADRALEGIRTEVRRAEDELQQLWRARRSFLAQMRNLMERQVTELETAESEPAPAFITDAVREMRREASRESSREAPREAPRESLREAPRDIARDSVRDSAVQAPRTTARDASGEAPRSAPRDASARDASARDASADPAKEGSRPGSLTPSWLDVVEETE